MGYERRRGTMQAVVIRLRRGRTTGGCLMAENIFKYLYEGIAKRVKMAETAIIEILFRLIY
jgi:hypothetical protein